jgi:hypothetical protein
LLQLATHAVLAARTRILGADPRHLTSRSMTALAGNIETAIRDGVAGPRGLGS